MKIYLSHASDFDYLSKLYQPLCASSLNAKHQFILPHEGGAAVDNKEVIKTADLVVAEVSLPSTG